MEIMDVDTKESVMTQQNSDSREHSRNSLKSAAGGASDQVNQQRSMGKDDGSRTAQYNQ